MEIDHYSQIAAIRTVLELREEIVLKAMALDRPSGRILDLGCGDGCFLEHATTRFAKLAPVGVDLSEGQIKKARTRMPGGHFVEGSLSKEFPFSDNEFDVIYCGEVIEHLYDPDFLLKEAFRVLRPGGYLYMTTPNLFAWYNRLLMLFGISPLFVEYSTKNSSVGYGPLRRIKFSSQPVGHLRIFHPRAFKDLQILYGFNNIRLIATCFEFFPRFIKTVDRFIAKFWCHGGSILISRAQKP